jgi:hypothetical protein
MPLLEKLSSKRQSKLRSKDNPQPEKDNLTPPGDNASLSTEAPPAFTQTSPAPPGSEEQLPNYRVEDGNPSGATAEELSSAFSSLNVGDLPTKPTPDTCLAHLKLLHTFHSLKEDIGFNDGLFGIWDAKAELSETRDETLSKMRDKRWALYIARAVERFEAWWLEVLCPLNNAQRLECKNMDSQFLPFSAFPDNGTPMRWTGDMLPPLGNFSEHFN